MSKRRTEPPSVRRRAGARDATTAPIVYRSIRSRDRMTHTLWRCASLTAATLACCDCTAWITRGPDAIPLVSLGVVEHATISGWVYESSPAGDPALPDALVEVVQATDSRQDNEHVAADGSYRMSVQRGWVTITTSKEGYESTTWHFTVLQDTVLNFGLEPL